MRTATYKLCDLQKFTIPLGFVGENEHCQIIFLADEAYAEYPHAAVSLTVRPPYGEPYPAVVTRDGNNVLWTIKDSDLTHSGQGEIQLSFTTGDVVAKTYVGKTKVCRSIVPTGNVPDPIDDFLTEAGAALTAIPETIDQEFEAIQAEAKTLEPGSQATAHFNGETKQLEIGVPEGEKGEPGYTPQRGVDYWTEADQAAMRQDIADDTTAARQAIAQDKAAAELAITQDKNAAQQAISEDRAAAITAIGNKGTEQVGAVANKGAEVLASIPSDYTELSEDVSELKSAIDFTPTLDNSDAEGPDLDIGDSDGNILVRFQNGHIRTKMFDSSNVLNSTPILADSNAEDPDLDIGDSDGNILVRFQSGHVKTKRFDSSDLEYAVESSHDNSSAELNIADVVGNVVLRVENGNIKTKRFNSLAVFPNIVTVKKDGTGDYTSLRDAVESISDADAVLNPYVIEVYEGTYNVCDYYTQAEIESAGEGHYTNTSFVGLKITNGISIRGVGCRNNIILYGYLDPTVYTTANRNNIATLNTQGECSLENLTIVGENIRYAVHDDFSDNFLNTYGRNPKRIIKNCVFISINTTGNTAYGAGTSQARDYFIDNCVFDGGIGIHKATGMKYSGTMIFENCSGSSMSIGDYSRNATEAVHILIVNNCAFEKIGIYKSENQGYNGQHIKMYGTGSLGTIVNVPSGFVYKTGDVVITKAQLSIGDVVNNDFGVGTYGTAYGICIGTYDGEAYVQHGGYIPVLLLGLSANVGDYATVSNGKAVISSSDSNAIGKVISSGSKLYIKLQI